MEVYGGKIEIYIEKAIYYLNYWHYHNQVEKINWLCLRWPVSAPKLILDCTFNKWILNVAYYTLQNLRALFHQKIKLWETCVITKWCMILLPLLFPSLDNQNG